MNAHNALAEFARAARGASIRQTGTGYRWSLDGRSSPIAWVEGENVVVNRGALSAPEEQLLAHPLVAGLDDNGRDFLLLPGARSFSRAVFDDGLNDPDDILDSVGLGDPAYAAYCKAAGAERRGLWREGFENGIPVEYLGALS